METLVCKQVYIESRQEELLKQWTAKTGMSEADIIRQALDQWLEAEEARRRRALAAWKEARTFIEARAAQGPVPGKRTWTRDELYEERMNRYGRHSS